jgi:hypothetical protein
MRRRLAALGVMLCAAAWGQTAAVQHGGGPFYIGGQINLVWQAHGAFPAAYSGPNSLSRLPEDALSRVLTLYTGLRLSGNSQIVFDLEESGGQGLGQVLGLAGFTNLDAVRNPELGTAPYVARAMVEHWFALGGGTRPVSEGPLSTFTRLPVRGVVVRAGKFSRPDCFDLNSAGSDSHLQFINWTVDNDGAHDYAADTRGYAWGVMAAYVAPSWELRFAEALMPSVANGIRLQTDLQRAHAENLKADWHPVPISRCAC